MINTFTSRTKARDFAKLTGGTFHDNGSAAGDQRWSVMTKSVTTNFPAIVYKNKMQHAREIVKANLQNPSHKRRHSIHQLQVLVDLSPQGASTYYHSIKKQLQQ